MIPAPFDYEVAESVDHAIALLGERDDAKLLAGGHSLLPAMKLRLARPALLVDVGRLDDLSYVREEGDTIAIGALTRHKDVAAAAAPPGALPDRLAHRRPGRRPAGASSRDDRRLARARRSGIRPPVGDPRARRRARRARARRRPRDPGAGVLHRRLPDGARRRPRCSWRSGCPSSAIGRLVVHEDEPSRPGLGDGGRRGGRRAFERLGRECVDRAHEHGRDAAAGDGGRAGDRRAEARSTTPPRSPPTARSRRPTTRRARTSAAISPACSRGGRSRRRLRARRGARGRSTIGPRGASAALRGSV